MFAINESFEVKDRSFSILEVFGSTFPIPEEEMTVEEEEYHFQLLKHIRERPNVMMDVFQGIQKGHGGAGDELKQRKEESEKLRKEGNELFQNGEFEKALVDGYDKAIHLTPNDDRLIVNYGLSSLKAAKATKNWEDRAKFAKQAMVYAAIGRMFNMKNLKCYYILIQSYEILGYFDAAERILEQVEEFQTDDEFQEFVDFLESNSIHADEEGDEEEEIFYFDDDTLNASVNDLFDIESDLMEQLFNLLHITHFIEFGFDDDDSDDSSDDVIETLHEMDFLEKLSKMPIITELVAGGNLKITHLDSKEMIFLLLAMMLPMKIWIKKNSEECPDSLMDLFVFLSKCIMDEAVIEKFNQRKVPFSDILLDHLTLIWLSIIKCSDRTKLFFEKLKPMNKLEWTLSLPVVYFTMINPRVYPETLVAVFRVVYWFRDEVDEVEQLLNKNMSKAKLKRILTNLASYGIIADRLFVTMNDASIDPNPMCEIKQFVRFFHVVLLRNIFSLNNENKIMVTNIPQIWLFFINSIEKYHSKPSYLNDLMETFGKLLEPWFYNLDGVQNQLVSAREPLSSMIATAIEKLFRPIERISRKGVQPDAAMAVVCGLFAVSPALVGKFCDIVPVQTFDVLRKPSSDEMGELAHFYWRILDQADDKLIENMLLSKSEHTYKPFEEMMAYAIMAMTWRHTVIPSRDYKLFHGCRLMTVLLEKAQELSSRGKESLKKSLNKLFHQEGSMANVKSTLNGIVKWTIKRQNDAKSSLSEMDSILNYVRTNGGELTPERIAQFTVIYKAHHAQCSDPEKIASVVNHLLDVWGKFDPRLPNIIERIRKKLNFPNVSFLVPENQIA